MEGKKMDLISRVTQIIEKSKQKRDKEFFENRTSWKWFMRIWDKENKGIYLANTKGFTELLLIEILKELQHLNKK